MEDQSSRGQQQDYNEEEQKGDEEVIEEFKNHIRDGSNDIEEWR